MIGRKKWLAVAVMTVSLFGAALPALAREAEPGDDRGGHRGRQGQTLRQVRTVRNRPVLRIQQAQVTPQVVKVDDRGGQGEAEVRGREAEPGDDRGGQGEVEVRGREAEPGDDRGGQGEAEVRGREAEPGDDRGGQGEAEPGDDHGGRGNEPGDDHGGHSGDDNRGKG